MIPRRLPTVHLFLTVLDQPTTEMQHLRARLTQGARFPSRRTWERRLGAIPDTLPAKIGCLGRYLVELLHPWATCGRAAASDSTVLAARGGVWHKQHREAGVAPHTSIDTEAHWTRSGWHGWVYVWKVHLVTTVAGIWAPLAARLTPANAADNETAPELVPELPDELRLLFGDRSSNDPDLVTCCAAQAITLVTTRRGRSPHTDGGVEVRRILHHLRSHAIANLNERSKAIFAVH